jgi:hypothetical protein
MAMLEAQAAMALGARGSTRRPLAPSSTMSGTPPSRPAITGTPAAVRQLLSDPTRRRTLGEAARQRARAHHDLGAARERLATALAHLRTSACVSA